MLICQVQALKSNLDTPNTMIGSCPACRYNFFNMFCTFTCSPDQSVFVNITGTDEIKGNLVVDELIRMPQKHSTSSHTVPRLRPRTLELCLKRSSIRNSTKRKHPRAARICFRVSAVFMRLE